MGLREWWSRLFGSRRSSEMVPFLDVVSGRVVRIPAAELRPGVVQVQVQGMDELVWVLPEQLKLGEIKHPPFEEDVREYLRQIQAAFQEHRNLSLEEWEEGFRRDANPLREIALWSHAADVYQKFAGDEPSDARRKDIYRTIVACMTSSPNTVWHVLKPTVLTRSEVEEVVHRFYGKRNE